MQHLNKMHLLGSIILALPLIACKEQNYRGVSEHVWKHLSVEQKQLIIDKTYQDEICKEKV